MDTNALYYTFSTVAQTLAAGFAILAAFVLYRLQGIEYQLTSANEVFSRFKDYMSIEEIWRHLLTNGFEPLEARMKEIEVEKKVGFYSRSTLEPPSGAVLLWWPIWKITVRWLRLALLATALDIGFCFVCLPLAPAIATNATLSYLLMGSAVLAGITAVGLYVRLIFLLLSPAKLSPIHG